MLTKNAAINERMKVSLGASKRPTVLYVEFDLFNRRSQGVSDSI